MILASISLSKLFSRISPVSPYCFSMIVNISSLAAFWTATFGVQDESTDRKIKIIDVVINSTTHIQRVSTILQCKTTMNSYIFASPSQTLYVNYGINKNPVLDTVEFMQAFGVCDTDVVYVDDIEHLPLIMSSPNITAQQDLINYSKLAMASGDIEMTNRNGAIDFLRTTSLFSNLVLLSYVDYNGSQEYTEANATNIASFSVKDVSVSKIKGSLSLIDMRNTLDVTLPKNTFTATAYPNADDDVIGELIPLAYGDLNKIKAICTNGKITSGNVSYRVAESMYSFGTIQVYKAESWVTATPVSISLSTGEFVLSATDARDNESPRECRCVNCIGTFKPTAPQLIYQLENIANGTLFNQTNYDTLEWYQESTAFNLATIGFYLNKETKLYECIRMIQEGSQKRFRYEFNAKGLRTIRIESLTRSANTTNGYVPWPDILENDSMEVYTDKDTIAAYIKIKYNKDHVDDEYMTVTNSSSAESIAQTVREKPTITFETFLTTTAEANERAALEASRLGVVRRFTDLTLRGKKYLSLRIYDIINVELFDDNNEWAGLWKCQVLGVSPDLTMLNNKCKLLLVERIALLDENKVLRITGTGNIRSDGTDGSIIRVVK